MRNSLNRTILILALSVAPLYAVSGTGVTIWRVHNDSIGKIFRYLRVYEVNQSHVDTMYDLITNDCTAGDYSLVGHPVINTHGTHVAFLRSTGTQAAPQFRITVMRLTNPNKRVELALFGRDTPDGNLIDGAGNLAWPQGDWIYFTTAKLCRYLYRVNTQTRAVEFMGYLNLASDGNFGRELKMSAIGGRISLAGGLYFSLQELQAAQNGAAKTGEWNGGGWFTVQGCGHTISASGAFMGNQVDPGHYLRIVTPLNWQTHRTGSSYLNYPQDRNRWSVDRTDPAMACRILEPVSQDSMIESVGVGDATYGNAYSVNSDKWECINSGWAPGGREGGNGRNLVLCNYTDSIALNVSRGPRRHEGSARVAPGCVVSVNWHIAEETGFFVSEPVADILPELRADATTDYSIPGLDDNTALPALTMMAQTPATGWPVVQAAGRQARGTVPGDDAVRRISGDRSTVRIEFASAGSHAVRIFDARGSMVVQRSGEGRIEDFTSRDGIRPGLYFIRLLANRRTATATVTVM